MVRKQQIRPTLKNHIKARYPIIALATSEEQRATRIITEIANGDAQFNPRMVFLGSLTRGLQQIFPEPEVTTAGNNETETATTSPVGDETELLGMIQTRLVTTSQTIYVLLDMHRAIEENHVFRRLLRDLHPQLKAKNSTIVLISPTLDIHADLQKDITLFDLPLPDKEELKEILCNRIHALNTQVRTKRDQLISKPEQKVKIEAELKELVPTAERLSAQATNNQDRIVYALQGLTSREADEVLSRCIVTKDLNVETILTGKEELVRKNGSLDYWQSDENLDSIGGLANLKRWIRSARNRFSEQAANIGLKPPRGILLCGAPGTGKTLSAKAISTYFGVPLLTMNMAGMASKFYGQTGNNMVAALKLAKAMSPVIVLIDEIEKSFGTGQGQGEHEESARTRGALLTAMEESEGIIWIATTNNPRILAPELMARFSTVFHVDLPGKAERKEIFSILLKKLGMDPVNFDMEKLVSVSAGYVGREVRNSLQESLGVAYDEVFAVELPEGKTEKDRPPVVMTTQHIITELHKITPTSVQRKEEIDSIRLWSKTNAQPANIPDEKEKVSEEILSRELEV
jgi:SpoVK/Ycf46/Vps4 family AAA+-type ATPase